MVVAVLIVVVNTANVNNDIKLVKDFFLPGPHDDSVGELASLKKHGRGKDLITVEGVAMRAD